MNRQRPIEPPIDVSAGAARFRVDASAGARFWQKVNAGRWEPVLLARLEDWLEPGVTFLDIGAWIGPTSLIAAAQGARVIALEPDPEAARAMRANMALNPELAARVVLIEQALHPSGQPVRLGDTDGKRGKSTTSLLNSDTEGAYEVASLTPAALLARATAMGRIVVKMDIEGGEYLLFPTAAALFDKRVRHAHISLHPTALIGTSQGPRRLLQWVRTAWRTAIILRALRGYRWTAIRGDETHESPLVNLLGPLGLCLWPLRGDWVLERRT